jgi:hypothetical protein
MLLPTKLYSPLKKKKCILNNMINYNNNFLKFIYKNKNKHNYIEANLERNGITRIRFLKPRIDFTSTKKIFEYKNFRVFHINTVYNSIEVYGKIKLEINNLGTYFKNISLKKKKIKSKLPWYITYNYINCIQNYLFFRKRLNKKLVKQLKLKTIDYSYNKFKIININIKRKIDVFYTMKFSKILKNFRNNLVMKRNFSEYILSKKQKKLVTTFRIKNGIFWSLFNLVNQIIKEITFLIKNWNINKINFIVFKKYLILKSFIFYIIKLSFYTLRRASFHYLYFARHLIIFFYSYLSKNILIYEKNNIIENVLNNLIKNDINDITINNIPYNIEYKLFNVINFKFLNKINSKLILDLFNIYLIFLFNIERKIKLFEDIKNNLKLQIDLYRSKIKGRKKPAHFLDFVIYLPYLKYSFKKLLPNLKLKNKLKKNYLLKKMIIKKKKITLSTILFNI